MNDLELTPPDVRFHASWLEAAHEFHDLGEFAHGSGLIPDDMADEDVLGEPWRLSRMDDVERFSAYCADMRARVDPDVVRPLGLVPDTKSFIVDGDTFLGSLSLRHELNDFLLEEGGHIGYSVRPTHRRRGVAREALQLGLAQARGLGLSRVLLTCDDDNEASARTIVGAGGVLEDVRRDKRRYWITLA